MSGALELIGRSLRGEVPPRALFFGLLNRVNYYLRTGDRRYEFERLYLDREDPWNYLSSDYEIAKYQRTLDTIRRLRPHAETLLEVACSIGGFTRLAAPHFREVVATDLSAEALERARQNVEAANVAFRRAHLQTLRLGRTFDVVTCAEVLCYVAEKDAAAVCRGLARHIKADGLLVYVGHPDQSSNGFFEFNGWRPVLTAAFEEVHAQLFDVPGRPYEIVSYRPRA